MAETASTELDNSVEAADIVYAEAMSTYGSRLEGGDIEIDNADPNKPGKTSTITLKSLRVREERDKFSADIVESLRRTSLDGQRVLGIDLERNPVSVVRVMVLGMIEEIDAKAEVEEKLPEGCIRGTIVRCTQGSGFAYVSPDGGGKSYYVRTGGKPQELSSSVVIRPTGEKTDGRSQHAIAELVG